nr:hypothetical protein [Tanacetum cinerariifolium]
MDTRKNIIDLEAFREMLHISPRVPGQSFAELSFEEEILECLRFLGQSAEIKTLTVSTAILPIELTTKDIRNTKAYKEYYAGAIGEVAPKPKASARRKRGASASSTTPPTPIATSTPITTVVAAPRLTAAAKGKQPARATSPTDPSDVERTEAEQLKIVLRRSMHETHISKQGGSSTDEGTDVDDQTKGRDDSEGEKTVEIDDNDDDQDEAEKVNDDDDDEEEISKIDEQEATESGEGADEETKSDGKSEDEETTKKEEESFDPITRTPKESEDDGNGEEDQGLRISEEERIQEEEEADELYRDVDINQGRGLQVSQDIDDSHVTLTPVHSDGQQESSSTSSFVTSLLNPIIDPGMESIFMTASSFVTPIPLPKSIMTPSIITTTTTASQPTIPPTSIPSDILQTLLTFASVFHFEDRVKSLEVNFSEFMRTNQSPEAVSNIPSIVHQYMHQEITEAVREVVQIQTDWLQDSLQRENDEFLRTIDDNMKKIIKEQAEVLTRSSHSLRTSYAVAADLSEMELKKILIDKMEGNKSIQRLDEQRNLYKALDEAYEADKTILDSYGELAILKRRREDDDDQEGPSAESDRGSKRRREKGEHASASTPSELAARSADMSTTGTQSRQMSASESAFAEEPVQTTCQIEEPLHPVFETGADDQLIVQTSKHPEWFSQLRKPPTPDHTPIDFFNFIMNRLDVDTLTPELLAGPTYELIRGSCNSLTELEYHLEEFYGFAVNRESALDVYSKRRIIAVTDLKMVEWHNYKHLDWISVRRDDDKIYKFKEGDFKRLRLQDIEDMLLLLVQGKLSNLTIEERFAFNVSLRMFTRSIVIQRPVEDLQLGVKSYQKRLNLTKADNDETLNDVRNALDDHLKGIRMQYLPTIIWRKGDKDIAAAMIQAIDKMLKTRRIMRSLE